MITTTVLAILGFALLAVLWAMYKAPASRRAVPAPAPATAIPAADPLDLDPWDARPGDVISVHGAAADFSDVDFPVDRRSAYESGNRRWIDLSGEFRGERVFLEVSRYPQKEYLGMLDPRERTLVELGLDEDKLVEFDKAQDQTRFLQYENKAWFYDSSREIAFHENETGPAEGLYRWVFREQNGSRVIVVEKWEGEPFEARLARQLDRSEITVYRSA